MTRVNNWLTDDQLAEILSGVVDGVEPTTQELTMAAELQERRKADSVRPVGYVSESAIFCLGIGQHEVITAKPEKDADDARYWDVIPLYAAPPVQETGVYKDMLNIIGLLENNEWAEHCTSTVLGSLLESEITRLVGKEQPAPERNRIRREHAEWSDKTFGDVGPIGPLKHLSKEALEVAANPSDPLEWADMQFLLWDAQRRMGISDEFITRAMIEKLEINKSRQWPEPKDGEPRLHIKEQSVPVVPETLPCPVHLVPGLRLGKGCKTETLLIALQRRAEYYAGLDAMTPEERIKYNDNIEAIRQLFPQPESPVTVLCLALERMLKMHELVMNKTNVGASFYDAECIREMNLAPIQAQQALTFARSKL